ncbi:hypothetical protein [Vibrio diabolicus]|uniref:hypothetical protein n=1 Tax=Vibrio diabolicus TaxID=50719 RepID=UPI00193CF580|nr:hypothetical protein [Vibrio diabolicus]MBM4857830.1 hypothetical protein [Vibrio parahaemolyticus]MBM5100599.1 hypothetical protein [Vibrio parahaemolyticus]MBM5105467.1 hypothetical protein [Vibrio parahaemolyticus]
MTILIILCLLRNMTRNLSSATGKVRVTTSKMPFATKHSRRTIVVSLVLSVAFRPSHWN